MKAQNLIIGICAVGTAFAPQEFFLVSALVIPHPFPGFTWALGRVIAAAACYAVLAIMVAVTVHHRRRRRVAQALFWGAGMVVILSGLATVGTLFSVPGFATMFGVSFLLALPLLALAWWNARAIQLSH